MVESRRKKKSKDDGNVKGSRGEGRREWHKEAQRMKEKRKRVESRAERKGSE